MKSSFLNLALLAPALAAGVLANGLSAQAITLNSGDTLNTAGELRVSGDGLLFDFAAPAGVNAGSNFIVTGGTGGFAPFALPSNANGPLPSPPNAYTVVDLDFSTFTQTGSVIPNNPLNNITNGSAAPLFDCAADPCFALEPTPVPFNWITMEIGDSPTNPDLTIQILEVDFITSLELGGGTTQTSASGLFRYVSDNVVSGPAAFNATFTQENQDGFTSYSSTFTVAEDVPEPSSVLALAAMAGMGALSLKKKSK